MSKQLASTTHHAMSFNLQQKFLDQRTKLICFQVGHTYSATRILTVSSLISSLCFPEYILPPIDSLPEKIEELTGITDQFLRCGGYDPALERELGPARDFRSVYHDFQAFCEQKAGGRPVVFVAHNAKFDIKMINGELRRWRHDADSAPTLGDTFATSLDTLQLFRERKWWRSFGSKPSLPRPDSFSLTALYSHVFNEDASNAHNAVGDIRNLERLLSSKQFYGWKDPANEIQVPFVKVES